MQALTQTGFPDLELAGRFSDARESMIWESGVFAELAASVRQQSALLVLEDATAKETIYAAYTHDLGLLQKYQREFEACMEAAVRCSIIADGRSIKPKREAWELLKMQIPAGMSKVLIDFPYTRAALPIPELLPEMKNEFNRGIQQVLEPLAEWLYGLVTGEFIGLVEWGDLDVCRYHYFKHEIDEKIAGEKQRRQDSFDPTQPYGSRRQIALISDQEIVRRQFRERHVHHIIRAKLHGLEGYPHRVPRHVAAFVDAIPVSLRPHMQIVEGTITMEEVYRRQIGEERFIKSEVLSVVKGSPGVLFGQFNLIGWSEDDLKSGGVFYAIQRELQREVRKQHVAQKRRRLVGHLFTA